MSRDEFTTAHAVEYLNQALSSMLPPMASDIVKALEAIAENTQSIARSLNHLANQPPPNRITLTQDDIKRLVDPDSA